MLSASGQCSEIREVIGEKTDKGLLADEDVLLPLQRWLSEGLRTVLVSLIGVEGGSPRQAGSQMVVAEDGSYAGYLSGGCLEQAVVLEALSALTERRNRLVRYGKGSPYFDVRLPCDSGLDLYFDQSLNCTLVERMVRLRAERKWFALTTSIVSGLSSLSECTEGALTDQCDRRGDLFIRAYPPSVRLAILGQGPAIAALGRLAASAGLELVVSTQDEVTKQACRHAGLAHSLDARKISKLTEDVDCATAIVLYYHDHEKEPEILEMVLKSPSFYIGAIGSQTVHRRRLQILQSRGASEDALARVRGPIGTIAGAKSATTLAIGILADVLAEAKNRNLVF